MGVTVPRALGLCVGLISPHGPMLLSPFLSLPLMAPQVDCFTVPNLCFYTLVSFAPLSILPTSPLHLTQLGYIAAFCCIVLYSVALLERGDLIQKVEQILFPNQVLGKILLPPSN